jgi:ParB family chromosome partitioning protein
MEISLDRVHIGEFDVRDEREEEHVKEIAESLNSDGQWNPIIVRPSENGDYDLIAGHTRYRAAKSLGWETLEATVKDVGHDEAMELALKTNLKRKSMSKLEEGKVVNQILDEESLTEQELADQIGKSSSWVNDRIRVALDLVPEVKGLVQEGDLTYSVAREVRRVDDERQLEFAELLIEQSVSDSATASKLRTRFENDTIYTIGYEGKDFDEFYEELVDADVDILIDVRASGESTYKPAFGADMLAERLPERGIEYRHEPELGVHRLVRNSYKDNAISHDCFESWYDWWLTEESNIDVSEITENLVSEGAPALLCIEHSAEPSDEQDIYCHRHFLAERMRQIEQNDRPLFPNRVDL